MPLVLYYSISDEKGIVTSVIQDETTVDAETLERGVVVSEIPVAEEQIGITATLIVNPIEEVVFYEYSKASADIITTQLIAENEKIKENFKSYTVKYKELNLSTATIEEVRLAKINQLKELCTQAIYEGFTSTSTGYTFGFNSHDQQNFDQQYLLIVSGDNAGDSIQWKSKDVGVVTLTEDEFRAVVKEARDHKLAQQNKYWQLEAQVLSATTNQEIDAIVWG